MFETLVNIGAIGLRITLFVAGVCIRIAAATVLNVAILKATNYVMMGFYRAAFALRAA